MPRRIPEKVRQEAVRLRVESRLGLKAICKLTGISQGTASVILRKYPLTEEELQQRRAAAASRTNGAKVRYDPKRSRLAQLIAGQPVSGNRKGRIAEAAVLLRLVLLGYEVWHDAFEGNRVDWLVTRPGFRRYLRLQVRWAKRGKRGRPYISTRRAGGMIELTKEDCDFLIGYDLETDTAFVFPVAERPHRRQQHCRPAFAEAWHLLEL